MVSPDRVVSTSVLGRSGGSTKTPSLAGHRSAEVIWRGSTYHVVEHEPGVWKSQHGPAFSL
ncbi:hypothetical protein CCUG60885_04244 [Mycobacteroides salmoniphilum]|uniref:Uncharacterized protein n=1 Tax=Mycobacteroides salmoniphilum TaxID=404941 RepID=A0A4R8SC00_9MYCO|nr:hypothetical protein CCUG60885_04244 [Mycobacteroides salmoniphilum]